VPSSIGRSESQAQFETENAGMRITFKVRERPPNSLSLGS